MSDFGPRRISAALPATPLSRRGFLGVLAAVGAVGATGTLAGCGSGGETSAGATAKSGGTVVLASFPGGTTLDPYGNSVNQWGNQAAYDTLTQIDENGEVVPWLATSWQYTSPTSLLVKLRQGVTFSDGTAFDAAAVKANLDYAKAKVDANDAADLSYGVAPYMNDLASVTVVDDQTARLELSRANPDFPFGFCQQAGWMISPKALANPAGLAMATYGTGPYTLDASASLSESSYTYVRRADYWAADRTPQFDQVIVKIVANPTAMENEVSAGQVDVMIGAGATDTVSGATLVNSAPVVFNSLVIVDLKGELCKPLGDVRVRQAMNYALDRDTILKTVLSGQGVANYSSIPLTTASQGYTKALGSYYSYDVAKAKALLAEAGYPNGFSVKVLVNSQFAAVPEAISGYLSAIGITLEISEHSTDIQQQSASGDWPIMTGVTNVTGEDYLDFMNLMTTASSFNPRGISDPVIDGYLAQAAATTDTAAQTLIYQELAEYAAEQAWFLIPAFGESRVAYNPKKVTVVMPKAKVGQCEMYDLYPA
jgi:peptide/nickel transport system substrate-binding protein